MTYRNLTNIDIALTDVGVTAQGFGTPLFASSHRYFPERVRAYTSLQSASEDLPTNSNAYKAVQGFFSVTPAPAVVKVGRREADLELSVASGATGASLVFHASDAGTPYSVVINITGEVDESAVATAIAAAIEGDTDVGGLVVASATGGTVSIDVAGAGSEFWVANLSKELSEVYNTTETASDLITALSDEDNDYYFFTCEDHSDTFVQAASAEIEARLKMYFTSIQLSNTLTAYNEGAATDLGGIIKDSGRDRTKVFFHHNADTVFPECIHIAGNATFDAGSVLWANIALPLSVSQDPVTGKALSATQKGYLEDRNISYMERGAGNGVVTSTAILRNNKVPSGNWISTIRGRDNMQVDLTAGMLSLLTAQRGTKLPYTDEGIDLIKSSVRNVLDLYVLRNFIKDNYVLDFLTEEQSSISDKQAGVYRGGKFQCELQQGILFVDLSGSLSIDLG